MAISFVTDVQNKKAQKTLLNTNNNLNQSQQKLASGKRVNSAKDDVAALQIIDRLSAQIQGLNQGNRNANDGIALIQTAEGAMDEMTNMLSRVRELAVQSANGVYSDTDRAAMQQEAQSLSDEINRIANNTTFAGEKILAGKDSGSALINENGDYYFQTGANAGDVVTAGMEQGFTLDGMREQIQQNNPNYDDSAAFTADGSSFDISTQAGAQATLEYIDNYIGTVDAARGELGAVQNRLSSTISNQSNIIVSEADARSRMRDTDYAEETSNYIQQSILEKGVIALMMQGRQQKASTAYSLLS